jgi:hypothetical protein
METALWTTETMEVVEMMINIFDECEKGPKQGWINASRLGLVPPETLPVGTWKVEIELGTVMQVAMPGVDMGVQFSLRMCSVKCHWQYAEEGYASCWMVPFESVQTLEHVSRQCRSYRRDAIVRESIRLGPCMAKRASVDL